MMVILETLALNQACASKIMRRIKFAASPEVTPPRAHAEVLSASQETQENDTEPWKVTVVHRGKR